MSEQACDACGRLMEGANLAARRFPEPSIDTKGAGRSAVDWNAPKVPYFPKNFSYYLRMKSVGWRKICDPCDERFARHCRSALKCKIACRLLVYVLLVAVVAWAVAVTPSHREPWRDTLVLAVAYGIALTYLLLAYERGGRAWLVRHGMITDDARPLHEVAVDVDGILEIIKLFLGSEAYKPRNKPDTAPVQAKLRYNGWVFRRQSANGPAKEQPGSPRPEGPSEEPGEPNDSNMRLWRNCISGFWGEAVIVSFAVTICLVIVWDCSYANLSLMAKSYWQAVIFLAIIIAAIICDYGFRQVQKAEAMGRSKSYCGNLADAYAAYGVYCWILFAFGAAMLGLLYMEFQYHGADFRNQQAKIMDLLASAQTVSLKATVAAHMERTELYKHALAYIEAAYGQLAYTDLALQNQVNPVLLFAALLVLINIVISHTGLKHLFMDDARIYTRFFTYFPLTMVCVVGAYIYFNSYELLLNSMAGALDRIKPDLAFADAETVKRLFEISAEVHRGQNIFGFAAAVGGAGSGAPLFLTGVKEVLDRVGEREALVEAGGELFRRPNAKFRPTSRSKADIAAELAERRRKIRDARADAQAKQHALAEALAIDPVV